jgi:hypothetical protein
MMDITHMWICLKFEQYDIATDNGSPMLEECDIVREVEGSTSKTTTLLLHPK